MTESELPMDGTGNVPSQRLHPRDPTRKGTPMCNDSLMRELEGQITDELALAESSRPEDPVVESDAGRRPNPTDVKRTRHGCSPCAVQSRLWRAAERLGPK